MLRTRIRAGPVAGLLLSLVLAVLLTLVHAGDWFVRDWAPKFGQPAATSFRLPFSPRMARLDHESSGARAYRHERVTVPRGELVGARERDRTVLARESARRPPSWPRLAGVFVVFATLGLGLTAYLRRFGQNRLKLLRAQVGMVVALVLLAVVAKAVILFTALPAFWIPLAAVPLWVATSFDRRTAFVVTFVASFLVAALLDFDLLVLFVLLVRGMSATLLYQTRKHARHMLASGVFGGACAAASYVAMMLWFDGRFDVLADVEKLLGSDLLGCLGGGVLAGLAAAGIRVPAERLLGHVSRERLLDLTDLEQPLLKKLATEAPGTFEHSRAMANLAEQAASSIGADALLTRVGAYYHDVGKTAQAKYFVENLGSDERSPHDELDPEVSADAIMAHVVIGTKLLREGGVPEPVVEFAYTHHGTQIVEFFWNKCLAQGNPKKLDASAFRYPGMKPQTKETAILMLVDSIEAASRTVHPPERDQFEPMVQRVIFTKLGQGQLDDCGLSLNDLRIIANRMVDTLVNMHHHRIKYQWQVQRAEEFGVPSQAVRDSASRLEVARPLSVEREPPQVSALPVRGSHEPTRASRGKSDR